MSVSAQHGSFTCGQLGWFTERLAAAGLVAVATAVSPALLAAGPGTGPVFGTNPMAYSVPRAGRPPLTVDRASSSTAFVSVRDAAARGTPLLEGWAVDADGRPTTDPEAALSGALLPFGGYKSANIAPLVELLSSVAAGRCARTSSSPSAASPVPPPPAGAGGPRAGCCGASSSTRNAPVPAASTCTRRTPQRPPGTAPRQPGQPVGPGAGAKVRV